MPTGNTSVRNNNYYKWRYWYLLWGTGLEFLRYNGRHAEEDNITHRHTCTGYYLAQLSFDATTSKCNASSLEFWAFRKRKKLYILFQFQWCIKICNYIHVVGSTCIQRNEKKELYSAIKHLMHIEIKTFPK